MSWGCCYFYYTCKSCGQLYKYAEDMIPVLGQRFGCCPGCGEANEPEHTGAIIPRDNEYPEVDA